MAFTTGTATDYADLLDKLRLYAVAQGWTQLNYVAGTVAGGGAELQLRGPGTGGTRQVFLNFRTVADTTNSFYSWKVRGATGYTSGSVEGGNPGELQAAVYLNTWQNAISYWFYVNDRRIVVIAKCSTAYMSLYAGFTLPFALPTQYPYPLLVSGDYSVAAIWSLANSGRRSCVDPGGSIAQPAAWARDAGGTWLPTFNHDAGANNDDTATTPASAAVRMWPYHTGEAVNGTGYESWASGAGGQSSGGVLDNMVATRQGERWIWPVMLLNTQFPAYGVLDGVYAVPGQGLSTEQLLTVGADNYRAFQNIQRSSGNDFFAVREL